MCGVQLELRKLQIQHLLQGRVGHKLSTLVETPNETLADTGQNLYWELDCKFLTATIFEEYFEHEQEVDLKPLFPSRSATTKMNLKL